MRFVAHGLLAAGQRPAASVVGKGRARIGRAFEHRLADRGVIAEELLSAQIGLGESGAGEDSQGEQVSCAGLLGDEGEPLALEIGQALDAVLPHEDRAMCRAGPRP